MNNNELSQLVRLKAPYFPVLGDVFIAVSAGDYRDGGFPNYFGEFFIFSAKGLGEPVGRRVYVHQHMLAGGAEELFQLTKARAAAELSDEITKRLGFDDSMKFDGEFVLEEGNWDQVATLYRAGLLDQKTLEDIQYKTRSSIVVTIVREVMSAAVVQFEEAKRR